MQLLPEELQLGLQLASDRQHRHGLPLEELVRHGRVLLREEDGGVEGAQEGEADDLCPASQGVAGVPRPPQ